MSLTHENPLGYEKISTLLKKFAVPSITAMLVSSLYNIVDQIFIGQGVGYLGNAATNVSYPLSTICLAISLLIGIGCSSRFSLHLGRKEPEQAAKIAGNGVTFMAIAGPLYFLIAEILLLPLLKLFGATAELLPYARQYARDALSHSHQRHEQSHPGGRKPQIFHALYGGRGNRQYHP